MRRSRGFSMTEVMVAGSLFLVVMVVAWAAFNLMQQSGLTLRASNEPRQQARALLMHLQDDLRSAAYIFPAGSYTVLGATLDVPDLGAQGPALVFAVPENSQPPLTFRVCYLFARPRSTPDPNNPDAHEIVYYTVPDIDPPVTDLPGDIDPNLLTGGTTRVFDVYLDGAGGLTVARSPDGNSASIEMAMRQKPARGALQTATYRTTLTMRNNQ